MDKTPSEFVQHVPCGECGSSDAAGIYTDGHTYCHSCGTYKHGDKVEETTSTPKKKTKGAPLIPLSAQEFGALNSRGLTEEACKKWRYGMSRVGDKPCQIANYFRDGELVAQKVRFPGKEFIMLGDIKKCGLYGQDMCRDGGKMLVLTEGEIDAISVSQAQGLKWATASVPNGSEGAKKAIQRELEWLNKFETVVFMFDMDEPGQDAAKECAELLPPGKAKIARLDRKDANECIQNSEGPKIIEAIWAAKEFRPDGILSGADIWDRIKADTKVPTIPFPWPKLNVLLGGMKRGELYTFTAGSGVGKSQIIREIVDYSIVNNQSKIGYIALEESPERTMLGLMSIRANKPLWQETSKFSDEDLKTAFDAVVKDDSVVLYDHWGSVGCDALLNKVRYMVNGLGCNIIVLDHISIVVSGEENGDERRLIDNIMTKLRKLVQELKCILLLVSHLRRPEGNKGYENGLEINLQALRGSAAIGQLSDAVVGLERNQQHETMKNVTTIRIIKNRRTGKTGVADLLLYDQETGRMRDISDAEVKLLEGSSGGGAFDNAGDEEEGKSRDF